jgi:anionic cell wall polymer biosynthesis LytR-Cps2A-Psr (LCP) family protein
MFALAEAIDIMGGIDITLEEDLIDPTYKIKEDGKWKTLHYKKGDYHLNGIQALRVARSRNYSSDFDRSRRQQMILESLLEKLRGLSLRGLDKIYDLIRVLISYVDTNLTPVELASYFNRFKSYEVSSRNVLDTDNVLHESYSNTYLLENTEDLEEDFDKGTYILLPVENDWNLIKWYIRKLIEEG